MEQKVKVSVAGVDLILDTNEEPQYIQQIADEVNSRIRELTKGSTYISTTMASVITALEYCDNQKKNFREISEVQSKVKELEDEISSLRLEADEARREIDRINTENQTLRAKIARQ